MEEIVSKKLCSGCTACANVCPQNAIIMTRDKEGFKQPVINQKKCIDCGLCKKTCPVLNTKEKKSINRCYVGYAKENSVKTKASSGGIFPLIANYVLDNKGIVIGAAFDENQTLNHIPIEKHEELYKLEGSKYLQSDLNNIFTYIKENVNSRKILFVGLPCQIAGLKAFLKKDHYNLICIDLVCHGVPSPKLFEKYIKELEEKQNDKLINYNFRDKTTGWDNYYNTATFEKSKITEPHNKNKYMKLFLSDIALRKSCYNCNFKLGNKYSDITLGDFWGVNNYYPEMYNKNGVSAIVINTEKGNEIFDCIKEKIEYKDCELEEIVAGNPSLKKSVKYPKKRQEFFEDLEQRSFDKLTKRYQIKERNIRKILRKIKKVLVRK